MRSRDIHFEKRNLKIKIPLNSDRSIIIEDKKYSYADVPRTLLKEIKEAFENPLLKESFISNIYDVLLNFKSKTENSEKAKETLVKIAAAFRLPWNDEEIISHMNKYSVKIKDGNNKYQISIDEKRIEAKNITNRV